MFAGMSTIRRAASAHLLALAAWPNGQRITHLYAADPARDALFALTGLRAARRGEA